MGNVEALMAARQDAGARLLQLPQVLGDEAAAYAVQRGVMGRLGAIGGWKVGAPGPEGAVTCAPLPLSGVVASGATVSESWDRGVEAEIAVRMGRDLPGRPEGYSRAEVVAAIESAHPAIELLQSRFVDVEAVPKLSALADSLSHWGLVVGAAIPGWAAVDLAGEEVAVLVDGVVVKRGRGNPAGDMIRLVVWLANEGALWAGGLRAGQYVTTGSWTGKDYVGAGARVRVAFDHCGEVEVVYG